MRRLLVVLVAAFAGACAGESSPAPASTAAGPTARHYVVFNSEGWSLQEAIRPTARNPAFAELEPSLDWWAEYDRLVPVSGGVQGQDLRVSAHSTSQAEHARELRGFQPTATTIDGRPALKSVGPDGKPAVITLAFSEDYTIMLLSYALTLDELRGLAGQLKPASEAEWVAAGGQITNCAPFDEACSTTTRS